MKKSREMNREKSKREQSRCGKMCWFLLKRKNDSITMERTEMKKCAYYYGTEGV